MHSLPDSRSRFPAPRSPFPVPDIREVKHDVYGKRQTAKIELLVSDFSRLYNLGKLFAFNVIKGFFPYFSTGFM